MIKIQLLKKIFTLSFLFILALGVMQPKALLAQSNEAVVNIPVSVVVKDGNDNIVERKDIKTEFKLRPLDGAPMPAEDSLILMGNQKASFDTIHFTAPGVYYYELSSKLLEGENAVLQNAKDLIIRIFVENSKDDSALLYRMDAYSKEHQSEAENQDVPKAAPNFVVLHSEGDSKNDSNEKEDPESAKKPDLVDTSASFNLWLYLMILGSGILLSIALGIIVRKENR